MNWRFRIVFMTHGKYESCTGGIKVSLPHTGTWNLRREYYICDCEVIDLSLMMIVEKFGGAFLGILAGSAVIRMFYEILNYVSSF